MELEKLYEKRANAVTQMKNLVDQAEKEDRGLTAEEREKWDKMEQDITGYDQRIEDRKHAEQYHVKVDEYVNDIKRPSGASETEQRNFETADKKAEISDEERYAQAFEKYARFGIGDMNSEERSILRTGFNTEKRAQSTVTTAGGYTIPRGFAGFIEDAMLAYSGIRQAVTSRGGNIRTATGNDLPFPTNNDTGNAGAILAENIQDSEQDLVFGELVLGAYKYTSKIIRVSVELLQDSAFNMEQYIGGKFGERLGRATAAHYATGTGTGQPNGLMTAATAGVTAASATAITYLEMLDLKHSVDPAYRVSPMWLFNDSTLKALKKLVDLDGRPLWSPAIAADAPATFDGDPYQIDQGIDSIATGNRTVAYGDMSKYLIRDVLGMQMVTLRERYADFHQAGFIAFMRTDADLLDAGTNPIKYLVQA